MKIITKSIIKEMFYVTFMGLFIFTFFLIMNTLFVLSDLVIKYGVGLWNVIKLLFLLLPSTVAITVPMAFLVGVLLTYSRLVQDNEYIGMQAGGISIVNISSPAIILSVLITITMLFFNNYVLPAANLSYKELYYEIVKKRSSIIIQEHAFIDEFDNYVFYIGNKDNKNDLLKNVIVFVKNAPGSANANDPARVILAKEGEIMSDEKSLRIALKLQKGIIQIGTYANPLKMNQVMFDTNLIELDIKGVLREKQDPDDLKGSREMTARELLDELDKGDLSRQDKNWLLIELNKKVSIPFAAIVFAFIGLPLGLMTKKGGRISGMSFSIVLIFIYYVFLSIGQNIGYRGKMNHFLAVWMPNFIIMFIGLVLFIAIMIPRIRRKPVKKAVP